ncbi:hypothetical protein B4U80_14282 [Leptotrombidium deliense]|uniref:2-C-methyl-D-erythritol 4-phosphate cytidylyltransferase n=1 Tax=Leptotrombidium deliense TaxID=299467 RepID=A0A443RYX7_9ACAR|nr:hypothetical protein B4U80_14282 [Leptotrombidium deliense]
MTKEANLIGYKSLTIVIFHREQRIMEAQTVNVQTAGFVTVILPSAGTGERMNCALPKQFINVNGSPLLLHTLRAFLR